MEKQLNQLVERLRRQYGDGLVSVILYGSAAAGDYHPGYSDLNVLCVLPQVTPHELALAEPVFHWWRNQGHPEPLLLAESEVTGSTDCFAIEYQDMLDRRRLLHGKDVIEGIRIDGGFYRAQVEYDLRTKLLRLRQKAGGVLHDRELLLRLMADSVSTFLVLARHVLRLAGHPSPNSRQETVAGLSQAFGMDPAPWEKLIHLREGKIKSRALDAADLFAQYLKEVQALIDQVDRLQR